MHASVLALFGACVLGSSFAGADILLGSISPWLGLMIFTWSSDGEPDFLDGEPLATMGQEMLVSHAAQRVDFFFEAEGEPEAGVPPCETVDPVLPFETHLGDPIAEAVWVDEAIQGNTSMASTSSAGQMHSSNISLSDFMQGSSCLGTMTPVRQNPPVRRRRVSTT